MRAPQRASRLAKGAAHVLGPAADGDIAVSQQDALRGRNDGLQARSAQAVDVIGGRVFGAAALDGGDARQVHVPGFGVDHVAEDDVADIPPLDAGARQRFAHHQRAQLYRRNVLQASAEGPDGGTHRAHYNDFTNHDCLCLLD